MLALAHFLFRCLQGHQARRGFFLRTATHAYFCQYRLEVKMH